jgi:hypothetical protein
VARSRRRVAAVAPPSTRWTAHHTLQGFSSMQHLKLLLSDFLKSTTRCLNLKNIKQETKLKRQILQRRTKKVFNLGNHMNKIVLWY